MDNLIAPLEQELRGESISAYTMPDGRETVLKRASHRKISWVCPKGHTWQARVYSVTGGCGCPYCAGFTPVPGETDLATTHPALAAEWSEENSLTPAQVSHGSQKRVRWRCPNGHEYEAAVYARAAGCGCPYCSGKKAMPGETDLATTHPALCAEWDREKNSISPRDVTAGSHRAIWWRCARGHSWQAAPYTRVGGAGCPYCANRKILPGFNDLATTHPALCREWDAERNGALTPEQLSFGSNRRVWWRCGEGHVWRAAVFSRTRERSSGCPVCSGTTRSRPRLHSAEPVRAVAAYPPRPQPDVSRPAVK